MKNQGIVPKDKLDVTKEVKPEEGTTTYILKSQKPTDETPVWLSVTVKPDDAKDVKLTPLDKDNKPVGETKVVQVPEGKVESTTVKFDTPTPADRVRVVLEPKSPLTPAGGDIISVVSCMSEQGKRYI